jgi:hypothetical protein
MPYAELDLTGMDFDSVDFEVAVLKANFGEGYGAGALVGSSAGLHKWKLSSGALPGDASYGSLIDGEARFDYYWDFFKARMAEGNGIFIVDFRGKKYHASFVEPRLSFEVFTYDLFGGGIEIEQRRVSGVVYESDGSVDATPPSIPTGLAATALGTTSIRVTWEAATDPESGIDGGDAGSSMGTTFDGGDSEG